MVNRHFHALYCVLRSQRGHSKTFTFPFVQALDATAAPMASELADQSTDEAFH
jgi:hypothetical protein